MRCRSVVQDGVQQRQTALLLDLVQQRLNFVLPLVVPRIDLRKAAANKTNDTQQYQFLRVSRVSKKEAKIAFMTILKSNEKFTV